LKYDSRDEISHEWLVRQYFNRVRSGDLHGLLDLFSDNCVIHEPFSCSKFLTGKIEIEPFFRSAIMANQGVQYEIKIEKERRKTVGNSMVAVVVFRKENEIKGKFTFDFKDVGEGEVEGIKSLKIEFIET
jgi:ketosteroid isomerase-like protein